MECLLRWEIYASIKLIMRSRPCIYGPELTNVQFLFFIFYQCLTIILSHLHNPQDDQKQDKKKNQNISMMSCYHNQA